MILKSEIDLFKMRIFMILQNFKHMENKCLTLHTEQHLGKAYRDIKILTITKPIFREEVKERQKM